jgi:hypothetical protein
MLKHFVFGEEDWAYLVTRKDGSYRLHYRKKPIQPISTPAWAPLVLSITLLLGSSILTYSIDSRD